MRLDVLVERSGSHLSKALQCVQPREEEVRFTGAYILCTPQIFGELG